MSSSSSSSSSTPLFIMYGSATGNAEHIAKDLAEKSNKLFAHQRRPVICCAMDQFKKQTTLLGPQTQRVTLLIVTSTTGNGDAPENASRFVRFIKRKTTACDTFAHVSYAVLGLGDTNYDKFCECACSVDKKMADLGATRIQPLACADEGTGLEDVVEPWTATILQHVERWDNQSDDSATTTTTKTCGTADESPAPVVDVPQTNCKEDSVGVATVRALLGVKPEQTIWDVDHSCLPTLTTTSRSSCELFRGNSTEDAACPPSNESFSTVSSGGYFNANRPFAASILKARYLTQTVPASDVPPTTTATTTDLEQAYTVLDEHFPLDCERNGKRVLELTLSLPDDYTIEYAPGDSLGMLIENTPRAVRYVLDMFAQHHNIQPNAPMTVDDGQPITVEEAVRQKFDLSSPIKNKRLIHSLSALATDKDEATVLRLLASKSEQGEKLFQQYVDGQRLTVVDILQQFPSLQTVSMPALLGILPSIPPRYYSVSSSPIAQKQLSLTIAFSVVDYRTPSLLVNNVEHGLRRIGGVATRYMEALCSPLLLLPGNNCTVPNALLIFPKPTAHFRMPSSLNVPLILIGPGTGVAPFMGFLAHRQALSNEASAAASTVVQGTWRGGYDVDSQELSMHQQRDAKGLKAIVSGGVVGSVDLFFGCRYENHDWLYRDEMIAWKQSGWITELHTAFSRENSTSKRYVQHVMREQAARLASLVLDQTASVFICGDGNAMAKEVQDAFVEILGEKLGCEDEAKNYLAEMKKQHRFLLDIWS